MPSRPWLPTTTWSKSPASAYSTMVRAGRPTVESVSTSWAAAARSVTSSRTPLSALFGRREPVVGGPGPPRGRAVDRVDDVQRGQLLVAELLEGVLDRGRCGVGAVDGHEYLHIRRFRTRRYKCASQFPPNRNPHTN